MSGILGSGPAYRPRKRPGFWSTIRAHADKPLRERMLRSAESFFWNTLCCTPDSKWRIFHWWYSWTGNAARYFHKKHCAYCLDGSQPPVEQAMSVTPTPQDAEAKGT